MAERSFVQEVQKLRLGAGEEFVGEGILAVTKALLESGVSYVAGYQGAPISHLIDVLADAQDILQEHGIRFENSASEATAAATLAASVNYPLRGAVTFKATVGTNVASDALANLASGGVTGGALIVVGEDYGEGSSIMQERSHAFAMKSQIWLLDPRPNLPSMVKAVKMGFELSEASHTPVMLQLRIRACHVHGRFTASDNVRAPFSLHEAMEQPKRDVSRIVLPPASFVHEQEKLTQRWPAAVAARGASAASEDDLAAAAVDLLLEMLLGGNGAVQAAVRELHGAYALAVVWAEAPGALVVARKAAPLLIGLGEGEFLCASDTPALAGFTRTILPMEDGEVALLTPLGIELYDAAGERVQRSPSLLSGTEHVADKRSFRHFMLKEIHEQPETAALWVARHLPDNGLVVMEIGAARRHYHAPLTRTMHIGKPPEAIKKLSEVIIEGGDEALAMAKPGVTCEQVEAVWQAVLKRNGVAPGSI